MTRPYIYVTVGPPACGKGTFYATKFARMFLTSLSDVPYVSSDRTREELYGSEGDQTDPELVFAVVRTRIRKHLERGESVYVDATHAKCAWREYLIDLAGLYDAHIIAIHFRVPFWVAVLRDFKRKRHVGVFVLLKYYLRGIDAPTISEGFDHVITLDQNYSLLKYE